MDNSRSCPSLSSSHFHTDPNQYCSCIPPWTQRESNLSEQRLRRCVISLALVFTSRKLTFRRLGQMKNFRTNPCITSTLLWLLAVAGGTVYHSLNKGPAKSTGLLTTFTPPGRYCHTPLSILCFLAKSWKENDKGLFQWEEEATAFWALLQRRPPPLPSIAR